MVCVAFKFVLCIAVFKFCNCYDKTRPFEILINETSTPNNKTYGGDQFVRYAILSGFVDIKLLYVSESKRKEYKHSLHVKIEGFLYQRMIIVQNYRSQC